MNLKTLDVNYITSLVIMQKKSLKISKGNQNYKPIKDRQYKGNQNHKPIKNGLYKGNQNHKPTKDRQYKCNQNHKL